MKLFYSPGASSLAAHIVASETGLRIEFDKVNLTTKTTASGRDYLRLNPNGYVPALLLDSGELLTEVSVLVQYLADLVPSSRLLPEFGTMERYRVQAWLGFIATELHKGFGPLWKPVSEPARRAALDHLGRRFSYLDRSLDGRPYLMGERFTVADAYAFAILNWSHFHKIDLGPWPRLAPYLRRIECRPGVRRALEDEGLVRAA